MNPKELQTVPYPDLHLLIENLDKAIYLPISPQQASIAEQLAIQIGYIRNNSMYWNKVVHKGNFSQIICAGLRDGDIGSALLTITLPNANQRTPGICITTVLANGRLLLADYDQTHGGLNRVVFSNGSESIIPLAITDFNNFPLHGGVVTQAMIDHMVKDHIGLTEVYDPFLSGDIGRMPLLNWPTPEGEYPIVPSFTRVGEVYEESQYEIVLPEKLDISAIY